MKRFLENLENFLQPCLSSLDNLVYHKFEKGRFDGLGLSFFFGILFTAPRYSGFCTDWTRFVKLPEKIHSLRTSTHNSAGDGSGDSTSATGSTRLPRLLATMKTPTRSQGNAFEPCLDLVMTTRLCFDEVEDHISNRDNSAEPDVPMGDLSQLSELQRGMNKMEVGDDDDSFVSYFSEASPSVSENNASEESGLHDVNISISSMSSPRPTDKHVREINPIFCATSAQNHINPMLCATPAPNHKFTKRDRRKTIGEVPKTPMKDQRFHPRTSNGMFSIGSIQEEPANINPFARNSDFSRAVTETEDVCDRSDGAKKRTAMEMHRTPDFPKMTIFTPDTGYGSRSRHKVPKTEDANVSFTLGSPLRVPSSADCSPSGSRYATEFVEMDKLGEGNFGVVTKVQKRLDGVVYAIKRTQDKMQRSTFPCVVNEVFALAALGCNENVLRYFSSWVENGYLYIQYEFCDAGTLKSNIVTNRRLSKPFAEDEIKRITKQTASGLLFLHDLNLAHLDVKPDNILMSHRSPVNHAHSQDSPALPDENLGKYIYKIGDLGHVRSYRDGPVTNCDDGDKHYLAPELLHTMDFTLHDPPKADVYSLGVTLFETARVCRGETDSSEIARRNGIIPGITNFPLVLNLLFQKMTAMDPLLRPNMYDVSVDPSIEILTKLRKPCGRSSDHWGIKPAILKIGHRLKVRSSSTQF